MLGGGGGESSEQVTQQEKVILRKRASLASSSNKMAHSLRLPFFTLIPKKGPEDSGFRRDCGAIRPGCFLEGKRGCASAVALAWRLGQSFWLPA